MSDVGPCRGESDWKNQCMVMLQSSNWSGATENLCHSLFISRENVAEKCPLISFGLTHQEKIKYLPNTSGNKNLLQDILEAGLQNLATISVDVCALPGYVPEVLNISGDFFASEKIMDVGFMKTLHERLGTKLLAAAVPRQGGLFVTDGFAPANAIKLFQITTKRIFETDEITQAISPLVFLLRNGAIVGTLDSKNEENKKANVVSITKDSVSDNAAKAKMKLILEVTGYQSLLIGPGSKGSFDERGGHIGRDTSNDWVLPDSEWYVSRFHAEIRFRDGVFSIFDNSINGVFVNGASNPLGKGNSHPLQAGDQLIIGEYPIRVSIDDGTQPAPEALPSQIFLDGVLNLTARVRVIEGGMRDDQPLGKKTLIEVDDPQALAKFRDAMRILDGSGGHCMCYGTPTLELISLKHQRLALIGVHHGESIRWGEWQDDAKLVNGRHLIEWLAAQGVTEPLTAYQIKNKNTDQAQIDFNRWVTVMPDSLKMLDWTGIIESQDSQPAIDALASEYPNITERLLTLFHWYGSGAGPWNGFPAYELLAEKILLRYSVDRLIEVLKRPSLTQAQLEGAARFFSGDAFQDPKKGLRISKLSIGFTEMLIFPRPRSDEPAKIPLALRQKLWKHCFATSDPEKHKWAESAFSSWPIRE